MNLFIKTESEIKSLRESGKRLASVLAAVMREARPGVSTFELDALAEKLMHVTEESLLAGISVLRPGARVKDYARAVQDHVEQSGFSVVRDLVGHSVGRELHEDIQIPNYVTRDLPNVTFEKGMTLALEPMVNAGKFYVKIASDGWTFV